jgi:hypothetical protein
MARGTKMHADLAELFLGRTKVGKKTSAPLKVALEKLLWLRADLAQTEPEPVSEYVEARLDFAWLGLDLPEDRGRVDYAFVGKTYGAVCDLKSGRGAHPSPSTDPQLLLYACALARKHPGVKFWGLSFLTPEQATVFHEEAVPREVMLEWDEVFRDAVQYCKDHPTEYHLGPQCKWCPAKAKCPAVTQSLGG